MRLFSVILWHKKSVLAKSLSFYVRILENSETELDCETILIFFNVCKFESDFILIRTKCVYSTACSCS